MVAKILQPYTRWMEIETQILFTPNLTKALQVNISACIFALIRVMVQRIYNTVLYPYFYRRKLCKTWLERWGARFPTRDEPRIKMEGPVHFHQSLVKTFQVNIF